MWLTPFGAAITLVLNFLWIPSSDAHFGGYMGSAWATLICYASMMILSYFVGQKYYRVDYDVVRVLGYLSLAIGLFLAGKFITVHSTVLDLIIKNMFVIIYIAAVVIIEKPQRLIRGARSSANEKS
jgi:hypothetical protein